MQAWYSAAVASSDSAERGSELCRRDPHPGNLKCTWVLCTLYLSMLQSWGKLRGKQVLRKGLCFPWSGVELLKAPQFGGIQASQMERETGANPEWKRGHEWKHWKAMASGSTAHRIGRGGTISPQNTHCYITAVSRKVTSGARKGWGPHASLRGDFTDQSVHTDLKGLLQTQLFPSIAFFFLPWRQYSDFYIAVLELMRAAWSSCQSESVG